eukprot:12023938-Alexandrium_andersonii.AAC.1
MNRVCPAKDLALAIGATFFRQFSKDDWAEPRASIEFATGPVFVSDFVLSSKQMVSDCREVCATTELQCHVDKAACVARREWEAHCAECDRTKPRSRWSWSYWTWYA